MSDLITITDAAKLAGLSRPRMSKIINAANLTKQKDGGSFLVCQSQVLDLIEDLRKQGKVRKAEPEIEAKTATPPSDLPKSDQPQLQSTAPTGIAHQRRWPLRWQQVFADSLKPWG